MSWTWAQRLVLAAGLAVYGCLWLAPHLGLVLLWSVLIPLAPALWVLGAGVWRNVCPLASVALWSDRGRRKPGYRQRLGLGLAGALLLFLLMPLRHVGLDGDGHATALLLTALGAAALVCGAVFERKSGWCAGLCPVFPVERLYGMDVGVTVANARCGSCVRCSVPCPDFTPGPSAARLPASTASRWTEVLMVGAFPGYVWGWFQVPDGAQGWLAAYGWPLGGAAVTLALYAGAGWVAGRRGLGARWQRPGARLAAALGVGCYYWYRLPRLVGCDPRHHAGLLLDLSGWLPWPAVLGLQVAVAGGLAGWLLLRRGQGRAWTARPPITS